MTDSADAWFSLAAETVGGTLTAVIAAEAASIRHLRLGETDLTHPLPGTGRAPLSSGAVLVPWPSRVRDGRWQQGGVTHELTITDHETHTALHGLLLDTKYQATSVSSDAVTLAATIVPAPGYPFTVETSVTYRVDSDGLTVSHELTNVGVAPAPVGLGTHPYLKIGGVPTADLRLTTQATQRILRDERLLPAGRESVAGTAFDFRVGRRVGDVQLNDTFLSFPGDSGDVLCELAGPDGRALEIWADRDFGYLQLFTTPGFPGEDLAVAVEPMTVPADAFNSGEGLRWLAPGEPWRLSWGIRPRGF